MKYRLAYTLAIWFGCGRFPKMPGTAGTIGAVPLFLLLAKGGPLTPRLQLLAEPAVNTLSPQAQAEQLQQAVPEFGLAENMLWRHSVAAALAAESMGSMCKTPLFAFLTNSSPGRPGRPSSGEKAGAW